MNSTTSERRRLRWAEEPKSATVVRLDGLGAQVVERLHRGQQRAPTALGRHERAHVVGIRQQRDAVAALAGDVGQQQRGVQRVVQLGQPSGRAISRPASGAVGQRGHRPTRVQQHHQVLAALGLELVDQSAAPRRAVAFQLMRRNSSSGRYSRTRSNSVLAPATRTGRPAGLRFEAAAHQQVVAAQFAQVGVDAHGLLRAGLAERATHQSERTVDAHDAGRRRRRRRGGADATW